MLVTLYKIGNVHFGLLNSNGYHVKAKNERLTAASSRCCQNIKYPNFTSSFGRLRQKIATKKACSSSSTISSYSSKQNIDLICDTDVTVAVAIC